MKCCRKSIILVILCSLLSEAAPLNVNTRGYALGQLVKVNSVGNLRKVIKGELLLGRNSEDRPSNSIIGSLGGGHTDNPFTFCAEQKWLDALDREIGNYVVIEYKTPKSSGLLSCSGRQQLLDIYRRKQSNFTNRQFGLFDHPPPTLGPDSHGILIGRFVNAFESGKRGNIWTVIIQKGNSGNNFNTLDIEDEDLFLYVVETLKHAATVKIYHYKKSTNSKFRHGNQHYIWKVELIDDL